MNASLFIVELMPVIILVGIGLLIKYKKAYWLISGYNTMSSEKKKNVDIEELGKFIANICFVIAAIILAAAILMFYKQIAVAGIAFAMMIPVIIYTLINAQKFDGNTRNSEGNMKTGTKVLIGSVVAVLALTGIGVGVLLHFSSKPAQYTLQAGVFEISGMYGQKIPIADISNLELKETIPEVTYKSNGSALGSMFKGYFTLKGIGEAKLFVDVSKPPFIYLESNSKTIIINCEDSQKTKELYEKLNEERQNSGKK